MSNPPKYLLVSLPTSISPSGHQDDALTTLRSTISTDYGTVYPFPIPDFKIGTLDALVQQADDLAKLESACEGVVSKVGDSLANILEGDEEKISQQRTVNAKPVDNYLRTFTWNKVKYRADKPIADLVDSLNKEIASIDNDVRSKYNQFNSAKTTLTALERKQTGNLSTKSLTQIVDPKTMIQDSEYLETHLIAVPEQQKKEYLKSYETLVPMVVPRSSTPISADSEFTLYSVTVFKKHGPEFTHKCREMKWTPREYKVKENGREEEQKDLDRTRRDERKLWGETLRLAGTGWGEAVMVWTHVLALRVFVETVLRYGLPLEFVCGLVKSTRKLSKKAKHSLDTAYSYLGGNAFGRDKKGRQTKDDASTAHEMQAAGQSVEGSEYSAYVYYEFEI